MVETNDVFSYNLNVLQGEKEIGIVLFSFNELYTLNFFAHTINKLSYNFGYRVDEGLSYKSDYKTLKEVSFFDFNINYNLGAIDFSLSVFNVLNFNNATYDIEPVLERTNNLETVIFSHEPVFSVVTSIAYNF